jgi:hypothetical protein
MADIAVASPLTSEALQPLRDRVRGRVLSAADEGYDEARLVHNGMFDRRPLAVLMAEQVGDVIDAVNFARENERWRPRHRHVGDAHGACGSEKQDCSCRRRRDVGRL